MNRIASVALNSAEKIDASVQTPSHRGSNRLHRSWKRKLRIGEMGQGRKRAQSKHRRDERIYRLAQRSLC